MIFNSFLDEEFLSKIQVQSPSNLRKDAPCKLILTIRNNTESVQLVIKFNWELASAIQGAIMLAKLAIVPVCMGIWRIETEKLQTPLCKLKEKGKLTLSKLVSVYNVTMNLTLTSI